jgi:hypothetical protein
MLLLTKSQVIQNLKYKDYGFELAKGIFEDEIYGVQDDETKYLVDSVKWLYEDEASLLTFEIAKKLVIGQTFGALVGQTFLNISDNDDRVKKIENLTITNFYEGDGKTPKFAITSDFDEIEFNGSFNASYDTMKECYVTGSGSDPIIVFLDRKSKSKSRSRSRSRSPLKKRRGRPLGSKNKISKAKSPCEKGKVRDPDTKRCREKKKPGPRPRRSRSLSGGGCQKYCPQRWRINEMTGRRVYDLNHVFYENWVVPNGKLAMQRQNGWKCSYCSCITY